MDIQFVAKDPLHVHQYANEHITIDTRYYDEYNDTTKAYTFYLKNVIRDVVEIKLLKFVVMQMIENNRNRLAVSIEELKYNGFIHPSGSTYQFVGEVVKTETEQFYFSDGIKPNMITSYFKPLNVFKCEPYTVFDRLTIKFYDGVDEPLAVNDDLIYRNCTIDFTFWSQFSGIMVVRFPDSDYYLPKITMYATYGVISGFTTSNPIADAALITYVNDPSGFIMQPIGAGGYGLPYPFYLFIKPSLMGVPHPIYGPPVIVAPPGPIGAYNNIITVNVAIKWKVQLQLEVKYKIPENDPEYINTGELNNIKQIKDKDANINITKIKQLSKMNIQRLLFPQYEHIYMSLDTKNAFSIIDKLTYQWNIEENNVRNRGGTSIKGKLKNIVGIKLSPIQLQVKNNYASPYFIENYHLLIHEIPGGFYGMYDRFHFILEKRPITSPVIHFELTPINQFKMLDTLRELSTITLGLVQVQNESKYISDNNIVPQDLLTTAYGILYFGNQYWSMIPSPIKFGFFYQTTDLQLGDVVVITGYINGTTEENRIINDENGFTIINIAPGMYSDEYTLSPTPSFGVWQTNGSYDRYSYLSITKKSSQTIINLEFLCII